MNVSAVVMPEKNDMVWVQEVALKGEPPRYYIHIGFTASVVVPTLLDLRAFAAVLNRTIAALDAGQVDSIKDISIRFGDAIPAEMVEGVPTAEAPKLECEDDEEVV